MTQEQYNYRNLPEKLIILNEFIKNNSKYDFDLILSLDDLEKVFLYCEEMNISLEEASNTFNSKHMIYSSHLRGILGYHII